jgi:hypothetical protein
MTPADTRSDDDLRARLEIAEATNHVLTELLYRLAGVLTPAQMAILGLPGHLSRPLGRAAAGCTCGEADDARRSA